MRTFVLLVLSLAASLVLGVGVGSVAMETLPCRWFGSGVDGACAYGAFWASIGMGLLIAVLSFVYLAFQIRRRRVPGG